MEHLGDTPSEAIVPTPETVWMGNDEERRDTLDEISMQIANKFINISFNENSNMPTGDGVHDYGRYLLSYGCLYTLRCEM